jgi:hypothetical protein
LQDIELARSSQPRACRRSFRIGEDVAAGGLASYRLYQRETSSEMRQVFMAAPGDE